MEFLTNDSNDSICSLDDIVNTTDNVLTFILLFLPVVVALLYGLLQKRNRKLCGCDRPSIVIPVNLLQTTPERWVYVLMFGAVSGELLVSILSNGFAFTSQAQSSVWGSTINTIFVMLLISLLYYPAFASIRAPIPLLGYCLGLLYCCFLFASSYVRISMGIRNCLGSNTTNSQILGSIVLGSLMPVSLSHLCILIWFLWKIVYESYRLWSSKKPKSEALFEMPIETHSRKRVRWLLSKWKVDPSEAGLGDAEDIISRQEGKYRKKAYSCLYKFYKSLYVYDPYIQYPLRFLAAIIIMVYIMFILTLSVTSIMFIYILPVVDSVKNAQDEVLLTSHFIEERNLNLNISINISRIILTVYDITRSSVLGAAVILPTGPLFSFLACIVLLLHMIRSVHIHLKKIAKGNYGFLPKKLASPSYRLVHSMQFIGFQVGYFTWAWILLTVVVWFAGLLGLIVYYLIRYFLDPIIRIGIAIILPLLYSFGLYYLQLFFTKLFFVGDTKNKHIVIKNIRLFQWFSYVMVFQNVVVGITSAFIRILYSMLFGILLLFRLDRVVLMKGFERFDKGHKSYIGFLSLEHSLNNPILRVFSELLLEALQKKKETEERELDKSVPLEVAMKEVWIDQSKGESYPRYSQKAFNKWMVCYTLLQNPSLIQFTAAHLQAKKNKKKKCLAISGTPTDNPCMSKSELEKPHEKENYEGEKENYEGDKENYEGEKQQEKVKGGVQIFIESSEGTLDAESSDHQLTIIND